MTAQAPGDCPDDPPSVLLRAVAEVIEPWLVSLVVRTAERLDPQGCTADLEGRARVLAAEQAPAVLGELERLLATDVDDQRANPLAVLRGAVDGPTGLLLDAGVPAPARDEFARRSFPDDRYDLGPATWRDVDDSLHEPGLVWGAWKAATVLRRRREEGLR